MVQRLGFLVVTQTARVRLPAWETVSFFFLTISLIHIETSLYENVFGY